MIQAISDSGLPVERPVSLAEAGDFFRRAKGALEEKGGR
jgi:hypothetical protein